MLMLGIVLLSTVAYSQDTASILGTVTDQTGGAVPNASEPTASCTASFRLTNARMKAMSSRNCVTATMPCARSTPTGPQWLTLVSAILASGLFAFVFATDWAAFAAFTAVAVTALIVARRTLLHPYIWYTPPFFLYGAAYPILVWLGDVAPAGPLRATLLLEWLALATFVMVVGPAEARVPQLRPLASPSRTVGWLLLGAASVPCFLLVSSVQSSGLMNSRQIVSNSNLFTTYHWGFSILTFAYLVLLGDAVVRKKRLWLPAALTAVGFGWGVRSLLIAGQRADIFRVLWVSLLMMHVLSPQFRRGRVTAIRSEERRVG